MEQEESEFNADFIRHMLPKLEWGALLAGAAALGVADGLPQAVPPAADDDDEFLQLLHTVLIDTQLLEGELVSETGRR